MSLTHANAVDRGLKDTKGIDLLMDNIFYTMTAINGFDSVSHYLRAALIVNTCATYQAAQTSSLQSFGSWYL